MFVYHSVIPQKGVQNVYKNLLGGEAHRIQNPKHAAQTTQEQERRI